MYAAFISSTGKCICRQAHPCAAKKANPSRGEDAKPKGLSKCRQPGCRTAIAAGQGSSALGEEGADVASHQTQLYETNVSLIITARPQATSRRSGRSPPERDKAAVRGVVTDLEGRSITPRPILLPLFTLITRVRRSGILGSSAANRKGT